MPPHVRSTQGRLNFFRVGGLRASRQSELSSVFVSDMENAASTVSIRVSLGWPARSTRGCQSILCTGLPTPSTLSEKLSTALDPDSGSGVKPGVDDERKSPSYFLMEVVSGTRRGRGLLRSEFVGD
jgi:hypothetical protein